MQRWEKQKKAARTWCGLSGGALTGRLNRREASLPPRPQRPCDTSRRISEVQEPHSEGGQGHGERGKRRWWSTRRDDRHFARQNIDSASATSRRTGPSISGARPVAAGSTAATWDRFSSMTNAPILVDTPRAECSSKARAQGVGKSPLGRSAGTKNYRPHHSLTFARHAARPDQPSDRERPCTASQPQPPSPA
jgi:hypothetical protein